MKADLSEIGTNQGDALKAIKKIVNYVLEGTFFSSGRVRVNVFLNMNRTAIVHGYHANDDMYLDPALSITTSGGVDEALRMTYERWQSATNPHFPQSRSILIGDVMEVVTRRTSRYFAVTLEGYREVDAPRWYGDSVPADTEDSVEALVPPPTHNRTTAQGRLTKQMGELLDERDGSLTEDDLWERYSASTSCDGCNRHDVPCVESGDFGQELGLCVHCSPRGHAARAIQGAEGARTLFPGRS